MRFLRTFLVFKLGAYVGFAAAAALMKRTLGSRGDEQSDELALVAIFDGIKLKSRAPAFRGGSMLAWYGGIDVDLTEAQLAPNAHLKLNALFGGIAIRIPAGWRVESRAKALAGGVDVRAVGADDSDAPTLMIDGMAVLGGIAVGAKKEDAAPAS
ncbi:MAG: LiaF-related protein [Gaiellaceae bacterium]